ncbi:MAG: lipopolysaccharide core heptose(I) kinase RfaP, partial [Pseudomonadales bacterium]
MADHFVREDVREFFSKHAPLDDAWAMSGEMVRHVAGRETLKVCLDEKIFYLKRHRGVGWLEVMKNWLVLKRPTMGARNEFAVCQHLERVGITAPTVAAFAETGALPTSRCSFVLCDALIGYEDLEQLTLKWFDEPADSLEMRRLVIRVAEFAKRFHESGVVHRDFYLCHLLLSNNPRREELGVLDLHRALIFDTLPDHWRQRDLAALLYSSLDLPLSRRAWLRFVRIYTGRPL